MVNYTREIPKEVKNIVTERVASTTAGTPTILSSTSYGENFYVTIQCTTGNIYYSPLSTAPATTDAWKLEEGEKEILKIPSYLSLLGGSTTAAFQAIIWKL